MKTYIFLFLIITYTCFQKVYASTDSLFLDAVEVRAIRGAAGFTLSKTTLNLKEITRNHDARDLPYTLQNTPSVMAYSDAGIGVGQTGLRIRGSDATRINVTINGVPFNDQESQGAFFGNVADIMSSATSVQIQRGAGGGVNGGSSFGAAIDISTIDNTPSKHSTSILDVQYGSFNTTRATAHYKSGLSQSNTMGEVRLSYLHSDGYLHNADANYYSGYGRYSWYKKKLNMHLLYFGALTRNVQAWFGVNKEQEQMDRRQNPALGHTSSGQIYKPKDYYTQHNVQLVMNHSLSARAQLSNTFFATAGLGFYDNIKADAQLTDHNLTLPNTPRADLITEKWLRNLNAGVLSSLRLRLNDKHNVVVGLTAMGYTGQHVKFFKTFNAPQNLYLRESIFPAEKFDLGVRADWDGKITPHVQLLATLQIRGVRHQIHGDDDVKDLFLNRNFLFINPKIGFRYHKGMHQFFSSLAFANREPTRLDLTQDARSKAEQMIDWEIGYHLTHSRVRFRSTIYTMFYMHQRILTGAVNDVGAFFRTSIDRSLRVGMENELHITIRRNFFYDGNITFSQNKIMDRQGKVVGNLSFSPTWIGAHTLAYLPLKSLRLELQLKHVGQQFLDNNSQKNLSLPAYYLLGARVSYHTGSRGKWLRDFVLHFALRNMLNYMYAPNGYMDGATAYFFPAAGINFNAGIRMEIGK